MVRWGRTCLGWIVVAVLAQGSAGAGAPGPPPSVPERVALAEVVVVGKVVGVEDKAVRALPPWGVGEKIEYQIASVHIQKGLRAPPGLTDLRVGFPSRPARRGVPGQPLAVGLEGVFFLARHPTETFFVVPTLYHMIPEVKNPQYEKEADLARRCARLLRAPLKGLRSEEARDRYLTASLLLIRYRTRPRTRQPVAEEPVGAEESLLILTTLAEADWKKPDPVLGYSLFPSYLFGRLGVKAADGFTRPKNAREFPESARKWLAEHAGSYRVKRFVAKK